MGFPSEEEFEYQRRVIRETFPQLFEALESELRYVDEHLSGLMPKPESKFDLALAAHLHLTWQLALLTTPKPYGKTQFPIALKPAEFRASQGGPENDP